MSSRNRPSVIAAVLALSSQGGMPLLPESSYKTPLPNSSFSKRKKRQRKAKR